MKWLKIVMFVIPCLMALLLQGQSTVTDQDGNVYSILNIGGLEWMSENLRVSTYRSGDSIAQVENMTLWQNATEGHWAHYGNDPDNEYIYGKLYNWYAVADPRGLCPEGWRVPSHNEWDVFTQNIDSEALGNNNRIGNFLKSRRQQNSPLGGEFDTQEHPRWESHHKRFGLDTYDFSALPGGGYHPGFGFVNLGSYAYFWTSTLNNPVQAWARVFLHSHRGMSRSAYRKEAGFSVRCIKGEGEPVIQPPIVETVGVTQIDSYSAIVTGNVVHNGGGVVTDRRIIFANHANPTMENHLESISSGEGTGIFEASLLNLSPSVTYYARAWALNQAGVTYGQVKQFTTQPEVIPEYTLTLSVVPSGSGSVIGSGVYMEGDEVLLQANPYSGFLFSHWADADGNELSQEASFTFTMPGTNMVIRSHFIQLSLAEVLTLPVTQITQTSASSGGEILDDGGATVTSRGLVWATFPGPNIGHNQGISEESIGDEPFISSILGLQPGTVYYVRAWASNAVGTSYGQEEVFQTEQPEETLYFLDLESIPSESGLLEGQGQYPQGATVDVSAHANDGYFFLYWKMDTEIISESSSFSYTMPANDIVLSAHFESISDTSVNEIIIDFSYAYPGEAATIQFFMNNDDPIVAFQMDIVLPEGFSWINGSYIPGPRAADHSSQQQSIQENKLRILAFSMTNQPIEGNDGLLFSIQIQCPTTYGVWPLEAENIILTNPDFGNVFTSITPGWIQIEDL